MPTPKLTVPSPEHIEHTARAADKVGSAIYAAIDGSLVLIAKGEDGRMLYPIVRAALDLVQEQRRQKRTRTPIRT